MRDLSLEAPGRRRNRTSSMNNATAIQRRLEEKKLTAPSLDV